jgi:hypothetical protein
MLNVILNGVLNVIIFSICAVFAIIEVTIRKTCRLISRLFECATYSFSDKDYAKNFERLEGIDIFNVDGNPVTYKKVFVALNLLPDSILQLIKDSGLKVIYSKDSKPVENGKYAGFYCHEDNYIYIWDSGLFGSWTWQVVTILHEVGHFIDIKVGVNNFNSCADVVLHQICTDEHTYYDKYSNDYFVSNIKEYFAQGFAEYHLDKEFSEKCPETSSYIEGIINRI